MALKLDLDIAEVQGVVNALATQPMGQVEALVNKIRAQVTPQLEAQQAAEKAAAEAAPVEVVAQ